MSDTLPTDRPAPLMSFTDVVLNSYALLLLEGLWLCIFAPIATIAAAVIIGLGREDVTFDRADVIVFALIALIVGAAIYGLAALFFFYLARKICERQRWSILLSVLITGIFSALLIIGSIKMDITSHLGMLTAGLVGLIIAILLSLVLFQRATLAQQP